MLDKEIQSSLDSTQPAVVFRNVVGVGEAVGRGAVVLYTDVPGLVTPDLHCTVENMVQV